MNINRIFIFGATGSGKTTLAKKISTLLKTPFYTTDNFVYKLKGWEKYPEKVRDKKLKTIASKKKWIIEGVHRGDWILPAFRKSTFVIILSIPRYKLLTRVTIREIYRMIKKESGKYINRDFWLLLKYAYIYKNDNFKAHQQLVKIFNKEFIILKSKSEISKFVNKLGELK